LPIGWPTLTVLIDKFSRFPLGYYLSFAAPSAPAVVGALRHAILPKTLSVAALRQLPFDKDWPVYGIPMRLVVDNGLEFHGKDLEGIATDLGMVIEYGGMWPMGSSRRWWLNQKTHSSVASSTASFVFHGARR